MNPRAVYVARYRRVYLAAAGRVRPVWTVARARGEETAPDRAGRLSELEVWYFPPLWLWSA